MRNILSILFAITIVGGAGGCGIAHQIQISKEGEEATTRFNKESAECADRFPDIHKKPALPRVECSMAAALSFEKEKAVTTGSNNVPLAELAAAKAKEIASRYDRGELTQDRFDLELAQLNYEFLTAAGANDQSVADRQAEAQAESMARLQQGLATAAVVMQQPSPPPPPMPPMPTTTNCSFYPGSATCRTY